jgi:hypothetical protein
MTESTLMMSLNAVWVAVMATVGLFAGGFVHSADRAGAER